MKVSIILILKQYFFLEFILIKSTLAFHTLIKAQWRS